MGYRYVQALIPLIQQHDSSIVQIFGASAYLILSLFYFHILSVSQKNRLTGGKWRRGGRGSFSCHVVHKEPRTGVLVLERVSETLTALTAPGPQTETLGK